MSHIETCNVETCKCNIDG